MKRIFFIIILSICFMACRDNKPGTLIAQPAVQIDSFPGECPYVTKDRKGATVLSWVRMINDSTTAFCYATSRDGKTFNAPVIIPNSNNIQPHGENLPKIIFKPSGEIIALWGLANPNPQNQYAGLVFYVQSFDEGKTWTNPKSLTSDTASYDQRYYDVALLSNGEVGIIWLDNRKTTAEEGSGLYFASTKGKNGFQQDRLISEPCCQCCRTDLFVDSKGYIHVLYRGIIQDSIRDMVHIVSTNGANTFSNPQRISDDNWVINGCPHTGPAMTENKEGLQFAWFTGGKNKGSFYANSKDNGNSFSSRNRISELGSHPQLGSFTNDKIIIVWDELVHTGDKVYKKIGVQQRAPGGRSEGTNFITTDTSTASYPVVVTLNETSSLVAYSNKVRDKNYVFYQLLDFK